MSKVIVIGLGAMGSATAQHLAQRGHTVLGFDHLSPPHTEGSSHGETRIIRQAYWEDWRYVPLLLRAYELWRKLEIDSGQSLLHLTGGLMIGPTEGDLGTRSALSAAKFHLPHRIFTRQELKQTYPVFSLEEGEAALWEPNAGYLVPETCVQEQLNQAGKHGADLHCNEPVLKWQAGASGGVTVSTVRGEYIADQLVITAGPWAPQILSDLHLPLRVTRQVACWFEPVTQPELFQEDRLPIYLFDSEPDLPLLYGFPSVPGQEGVKVALHGSQEICTPETVDRQIRPAEIEGIRQRLSHRIPSLNGRLLRAETCLYTMTPDEHFYIDMHPQHPQVALAAGFSGHGFKFANVVGEILADLATERYSAFDLSLFSLQRP